MRVVLISLLLLFAGTGRAETPRWDDATRLALAQCFVGEAGWRNRIEHAAIGHVLKKRWETVRANQANYRFLTMVRSYCAAHRAKSPSRRQQWVRALPWGPLLKDPGMGLVWEYYIGAWDYVRNTVRLFEFGRLEDPLPSAVHWGSIEDIPPEDTVQLPRTIVVGGRRVRFLNLFYRYTGSIIRHGKKGSRQKTARNQFRERSLQQAI